MQHLHAVITGRVQGVGFRWFAMRRALVLGIHGQARNLPDGSVEVEAEGERGALKSFVDDLHVGPPSAVVERVEARWSEGPARHHDFLVIG